MKENRHKIGKTDSVLNGKVLFDIFFRLTCDVMVVNSTYVKYTLDFK